MVAALVRCTTPPTCPRRHVPTARRRPTPRAPTAPVLEREDRWRRDGGARALRRRVNGKRRRGWRRRVQGRARERARVRKEPWGAERAIHRWVHSPVEPFTGGAIRTWSHSQVEPFTGGAIHSWSRADLAADGVRGLTCRTQSPCRSFVCWPCTPSQSPWASRRTWARARVGVRVEPGGAGGAGWG